MYDLISSFIIYIALDYVTPTASRQQITCKSAGHTIDLLDNCE